MIDWRVVAGAFLHPTKIAILEAMERHQPLTPTDLQRLIDGPQLSVIAYHVRQLANAGVVECVRTEPVRGSVAHYYAPSLESRARQRASAAGPGAT